MLSLRGALLGSVFLVFAACNQPDKPATVGEPNSIDSVAGLPGSAGVVEVLNGTGRRGAANLVAERLRRQGYDVVKIGNAPERNYSRTLVAERRVGAGIAAGVAKAIGVPTTFAYHNENLLVDATVFVGRDFEEILPP
ncbi:MAG: LytR C-terminal domain-containing protein [Fibrobacterota bacterium]